MKLVITEDAKADLKEIKDFIRPHNSKRAESFIDELLDKCAGLAFCLIDFYAFTN